MYKMLFKMTLQLHFKKLFATYNKNSFSTVIICLLVSIVIVTMKIVTTTVLFVGLYSYLVIDGYIIVILWL